LHTQGQSGRVGMVYRATSPDRTDCRRNDPACPSRKEHFVTPQRNNKSVIPTIAWVLAALAPGLALLVCLAVATNGKLRPPEFLILIFGACLLGAFILLIGYIHNDAKRRGMRYVLWTWLAILIPNGLGIILSFILREPLMVYCSRCGSPGKPGLPYCPNCGQAMAPTCPNCKHVVQSGWPHCAYCGTSLTPGRTSPSAPTTG